MGPNGAHGGEPPAAGSPDAATGWGGRVGNPIGFESWGSRTPQTVTPPPAQARLGHAAAAAGRDAPVAATRAPRRHTPGQMAAWVRHSPEPRSPSTRSTTRAAGSTRPVKGAARFAVHAQPRRTPRERRPSTGAARRVQACKEDVNAAFVALGQALTHRPDVQSPETRAAAAPTARLAPWNAASTTLKITRFSSRRLRR